MFCVLFKDKKFQGWLYGEGNEQRAVTHLENYRLGYDQIGRIKGFDTLGDWWRYHDRKEPSLSDCDMLLSIDKFIEQDGWFIDIDKFLAA